MAVVISGPTEAGEFALPAEADEGRVSDGVIGSARDDHAASFSGRLGSGRLFDVADHPWIGAAPVKRAAE